MNNCTRPSVVIEQKVIEFMQAKIDGKVCLVEDTLKTIVQSINSRLQAEKKMSIDPLIPRVKRQLLVTRHMELLEKFNRETERLKMLREEAASKTASFNSHKALIRRETYVDMAKNEMYVTTQKEKVKLRVKGIFTERLVDSFHTRDMNDDGVERNKTLWRFQRLQRDLVGPGFVPNYLDFNVPDMYLYRYDLEILIEVIISIETLFHQRNTDEKLMGSKVHPLLYQKCCGIIGFCIQLCVKLILNSTVSYLPPSKEAANTTPTATGTTTATTSTTATAAAINSSNSKSNTAASNRRDSSSAAAPASKAKSGKNKAAITADIKPDIPVVTIADLRLRYHPDTVRLFLFLTIRTLSCLLSFPDMANILLENRVEENLAFLARKEEEAAEAAVDNAFERKEVIIPCLCFQAKLWGPFIDVDKESGVMNIEPSQEYDNSLMEADIVSLMRVVYKYYVLLFVKPPGTLPFVKRPLRRFIKEDDIDLINDPLDDDTVNITLSSIPDRNLPKPRVPLYVSVDVNERFEPFLQEHILFGSPIITDLQQICFFLIMRYASSKPKGFSNTDPIGSYPYYDVKTPGQGVFDPQTHKRVKDGFLGEPLAIFTCVPLAYFGLEIAIRSLDKMLIQQTSDGNISYSDPTMLKTLDEEVAAGIRLSIATTSCGLIFPNAIHLLSQATVLSQARKSCFPIQVALVYAVETFLLCGMNYAETESELVKRLQLDISQAKIDAKIERRAHKIEMKRRQLGIDKNNPEGMSKIVVSDDEEHVNSPSFTGFVESRSRVIALIESFFPVEKSIPIKIGLEENINSRQFYLYLLGPETLYYIFRIMNNLRNTYTIIHHGLIIARLLMRQAFIKRLEIDYIFSLSRFDGNYISFATSKTMNEDNAEEDNDNSSVTSAANTNDDTASIGGASANNTVSSGGGKSAGAIAKQFDNWKNEAYTTNLGPLIGLPHMGLLDLLRFIFDNHFQSPEIIEQALLLIQQLCVLSNEIKIFMMDSDLRINLRRVADMFHNSVYITALAEICLDEMEFKTGN